MSEQPLEEYSLTILTTFGYVITIITYFLVEVDMHTKLITIGNSKGIRLPKKLIEKYHLHDSLNLEEKKEGILIKADIPENKLTWEETYREMARENEDWSDMDALAGDGVE
jgi:antitoxin MazE